MLIGLFYLSCVSHSLLELPVFDQQMTWPLFQLLTQLFSDSSMLLFFPSVVSGIFLTNCPYILLLFHSSLFSLVQLCLNSFLFTVLLYTSVPAAFTPSVHVSTEFLTYHPKLSFSILMHYLQWINPRPSISLLRYILST